VWGDMRWRAYRSLEEGSVDYLSSLRSRFAAAWPGVLAGDPVAFVHELKRAGYFTDTEAAYSADVQRVFNLYQASLQFDTNPPLIDDETRARVEGLVAISLSELSGADTLVPPAPDTLVPPPDRTTLPDA